MIPPLMKPKEHGAWGMLLIPFFTAVGVTKTLTWPMALVLCACILVFISQRPLAAVLKGMPLTSPNASHNLLHIAGCWGGAALAVALLFVRYDRSGILWLLLPALPIAAAFVYCMRHGQTHSVAGEWVGVIGLTLTAPLTHYVAVGVVGRLTLLLWGLNILYFGSSIFFIKAKVQQYRLERSGLSSGGTRMHQVCLLYHWILVASLVGLGTLRLLPVLSLLAFAPIIARGIWGIRRPASSLNFRQIGFREVGYSIFFALMLSCSSFSG